MEAKKIVEFRHGDYASSLRELTYEQCCELKIMIESRCIDCTNGDRCAVRQQEVRDNRREQLSDTITNAINTLEKMRCYALGIQYYNPDTRLDRQDIICDVNGRYYISMHRQPLALIGQVAEHLMQDRDIPKYKEGSIKGIRLDGAYCDYSGTANHDVGNGLDIRYDVCLRAVQEACARFTFGEYNPKLEEAEKAWSEVNHEQGKEF